MTPDTVSVPCKLQTNPKTVIKRTQTDHSGMSAMKTSTRLACCFALALSAIATGPTAWGQWDSGVRQGNYQKQLPTTVDASKVPATFAQRVDPEIDRQMRSLVWRCVGPFVGNRGCGVEMHPTDRNVYLSRTFIGRSVEDRGCGPILGAHYRRPDQCWIRGSDRSGSPASPM